MRELQGLELQAVNGGAGSSKVLLGVGIAAMCVVGIVCIGAMRRVEDHEDHIIVVTAPDKKPGTNS